MTPDSAGNHTKTRKEAIQLLSLPTRFIAVNIKFLLLNLKAGTDSVIVGLLLSALSRFTCSNASVNSAGQRASSAISERQ